MEDIFDLEHLDFIDSSPKMTSEEFVSKTKKLLSKIMSDYSNAWSWRRITEEEFKITPCDACKGESEFEFCGKKVNCVADREMGECAERVFDSEDFVQSLEDAMFHDKDSPFIDLMECEITKPVLAVEGSGNKNSNDK
jgi:hypothetical protein